jgi:hypothetical protein
MVRVTRKLRLLGFQEELMGIKKGIKEVTKKPTGGGDPWRDPHGGKRPPKGF